MPTKRENSLLRGWPGGRMAMAVRRLRILIVEDYEDNGELLAAALTMRGHTARLVVDAASALAAAPALAPDVAIVDIKLPDMDGYVLGQKLRALPGLDRLCLLAISGFARDPDEANEAGFHGHVMKPVTLERLEESIQDALEKVNPLP